MIPYPYRPDADLLYMTGLQQPASLAVVQHTGQLTLFVPDKDTWRETWDGQKLNPEAGVEVFRADEAYSMSEVGGCSMGAAVGMGVGRCRRGRWTACRTGVGAAAGG